VSSFTPSSEAPGIYGPVKKNELWRIRRKDELEATMKGENIVMFIECQRI
jgi:hypothetical protein